MKKIALILCVFLCFCFCSCDLLGETTQLQEVLNELELEENNKEIKEDFILDKQLVEDGKTYNIIWSTNSTHISFKDEKLYYLVDIDFASVEGRTKVILTATITEGEEIASKSFQFFINGTGGSNTSTSSQENSGSQSSAGGSGETPTPDTDTIKATKTKFNNRLDTDGPLTEEAFPSVGKPKMLVIPINLDSAQKTDANLQEIKKAFIGSEAETGWESVKSYYYESSYGKLDMQIEVVNEWFTPSKIASYYNNYSYNEEDGSVLILREALAYYNSRYDYNDYDYDKDGFIDGVWLIYNCAVNYLDDNSLFWAFTSWNYDETKYDGTEAYYYAWAGIDFMHPSAEEAGYYDPSDIKIDAHTYIHETGHLMGLDDYYDYNEMSGVNSYGFYGCDMMDGNIGDHAAINKLLLGWVEPTVVTGKGNITLDMKPFATAGEFIIIADHKLNSIYDTYYTLEFYTNDGLNAHDKPFDSNFAPYGIRVMKIRAEKNIVNGSVEYNSGDYQTGFKYDNSDESVMFADGLYSSSPKAFNIYSADAACLFQTNEALNQTNLPFMLKVNSMNRSTANITITLK